MKLKTMLAVVAGALGLCATAAVELPDGVSFEQTPGVVEPGDIVEAKGATWATTNAANTTLEVKAYGTETKYVYQNPDNARNEMFDAQDNYLSVKTKFGSPLNRTAEVEIGEGVYFDSLVKFTACDEAPAADSYSDAKLVAYVLEDETNGETNFFVRAVGGDYNLGAVTDIDSWHRLTIKAIPGIYKEDRPVPGFAIYLDGNAVAATDEDYATRSTITVANLTNNAKVLFTAKNLFVSLNGGTANYQKITSVGFDGQGAIDDLAFTTTAPVTAAADLLFATVKIGEKIESFVVDGVTYTADADAQIIGGKVLVSSITYKTGFFGPANLELDADSGDELKLDETAKTIVAKILDANYESIEAALGEAQDSDVIVLQTDVDAKAAIEVNKVVTIDLNGCTVTGATDANVFEVSADVTFRDSKTGGKVVATGTDDPVFAVYASEVAPDAVVVITGGTYAGNSDDGDVLLNGKTITGGWFKYEPAEDFIAEGYEAVVDAEHDDYYKVQEKQVEQGTVIIIVDGAEKKTLEPQEVGTTVNLTAIDGLKETWQKLTWANVDDPTAYEVVKGEQTLNATTDIDLTFKEGSYQIDTDANLQTLADAVAGGYVTAGKTFKQTATISLKGKTWEGIGTAKAADHFDGEYDGNGQLIENVTFAKKKYNGLFGNVGGAAKIHDLTVKVVGIADFDKTDTTEYGAAGLVGFSCGTGVVIENVTVAGQTTETVLSGTHNIGGIGCRLEGDITLKNCTNNLALYTTYSKIAGMCAIASSATKIGDTYCNGNIVFDGCVNTAAITGEVVNSSKGGSDGVAGIIAYIQGYADADTDKTKKRLTIKNCKNTGKMTGGCPAAFIGKVESGIGLTGSKVEIGEISGNVVDMNTVACGNTIANIDGLCYAQNDAYVVNATALAKDATSVLTATGLKPTFELLAAGDYIAFDETLTKGDFTGITAKGDLTIATNVTGKVTKFTAKAAAPQGVEPGKPVGLGNPGSMTLEEAQEAASKLAPVPTAEQTADGITADDLQVKAVFNGSVYQAVAEPADEYIPEVKTEGEDVQPIEVTATDFSATIKNAKKGFYYGFVAADELKANVKFTPAATFEKATGNGALKLTAPTKGNARFYKLSVSAVPVKVGEE